MTVVVFHESTYGNTHEIAEAVAQGLGEAGTTAAVRSAAPPESSLVSTGGRLLPGEADRTRRGHDLTGAL